MKQAKFLFLLITTLAFVSCSSEEDYDVNNLAGTWEQVYDDRVQDVGTEQYVFFPESSTTGRIEV